MSIPPKRTPEEIQPEPGPEPALSQKAEPIGPRLVRRANELSHRAVDRDEGIDPWSLYVAQPNARDARKLQCRVEPEIEAMIETLIASKLFRWTSLADFVRWAVCGDGMAIERAQRLLKHPELNNAVRAMNTLNQMLRMRLKQREMDGQLRAMREFLQDQIRAGAVRQVKKDLTSLRTQVDSMDEGYYRDRATKILDEFDGIVEAEEIAAVGARARAKRRSKEGKK